MKLILLFKVGAQTTITKVEVAWNGQDKIERLIEQSWPEFKGKEEGYGPNASAWRCFSRGDSNLTHWLRTYDIDFATQTLQEGDTIYVGWTPAQPQEAKPTELGTHGKDAPKPKKTVYFSEASFGGTVTGCVTCGFTGEQLEQGLDTSRKDKVINRFHDPFGIASVRPDEHAASKCTTYADLLRFELNPLSLSDDNNARPPRKIADELNVMNFIWMGGPLTPERGQGIAEQFQEVGKVPTVFLWVDSSRQQFATAVNTDKLWRQMAEWCAKREIVVLSIEEVFSGNASLALLDLFNLSRLQRQWGLASDILRIEILFRFGGMYSDLDNDCLDVVDPYALTRTFNDEERPVLRLAIGLMDRDLCNAFLISDKLNPFLAFYMMLIKKTFQLTRKQLCELAIGGTCPEYEDGFVRSTEATVHEVVMKTGPNGLAKALIDYLWKNQFEEFDAYGFETTNMPASYISLIQSLQNFEGFVQRGKPDTNFVSNKPELERKARPFIAGLLVPTSVVRINSAASWLARRVLPLSTLEDARVALTCVLYHLVNNPPVLDLMSVPPTVCLRVLVDVIKRRFPQLLAGVKEVWIPAVCAQDLVMDILVALGFQRVQRIMEKLRGEDHDEAYVLSRGEM